MVKAELYYGAFKSNYREKTLKRLDQFLGALNSFEFGDKEALTYGQIRANLANKGTPIGPNDLMIAAIAVCNNLTLVTHNTKEFNRVENLIIEDWENNNE